MWMAPTLRWLVPWRRRHLGKRASGQAGGWVGGRLAHQPGQPVNQAARQPGSWGMRTPQALALDPCNIKALFRRGCAYANAQDPRLSDGLVWLSSCLAAFCFAIWLSGLAVSFGGCITGLVHG